MKNIWDKIKIESERFINNEPVIEKVIRYNITGKENFWASIASILSKKLANEYLPKKELEKIIIQILEEDKEIQKQIITDLQGYYDRDFACNSYLEVLLFYRGFQAVSAYRIARSFYLKDQKLTSKFFQNRIFEVYAMDIHPNAKLGKGIVIDHGIGLVIGETSEIGDNAFIFHNVTLGGTGHAGGDRHPKIKNNVFIGAGATILGNITINDNVNIAASSVVTKDVDANTTVAGIPAKVIGKAKKLQ
ncbi:serine O-acetyltransferase EpsC [Aquimarina muelleri]|uniref:Serine acetyltransferase n=1 Tax=Aquimarina muelleri TaxID=279356 RepID=A0A918JYY8_9FLAO|nr:serine O-acetyltransferase EpsC [Aquimarina muelleri]MCX2764165.1 serine acetyltransferase [Aquimarina muelleri]GGX31613.1 serine O-acetyltransferase [Aquimarina muelleri]